VITLVPPNYNRVIIVVVRNDRIGSIYTSGLNISLVVAAVDG
jgi:hypothetical protein